MEARGANHAIVVLLLAVVLAGCLRSGVVRVFAAAAVLVLGLTPQVTNRDSAVMSESLSISLGVLTLALLIRFFQGGGRTAWAALVGLTLCAFWWTLVRAETRLMVGFVVLVLIGYAVFRAPRRWAAVAAAATLCLGIGG